MKGYKVGTNGEEGWCEIKKEKKKRGFDGLVNGWTEEKVKEGGNDKCREKRKCIWRESGVGSHEKDDRPGVFQVKGEGGQHDEGTTTEAKDEP